MTQLQCWGKVEASWGKPTGLEFSKILTFTVNTSQYGNSWSYMKANLQTFLILLSHMTHSCFPCRRRCWRGQRWTACCSIRSLMLIAHSGDGRHIQEAPDKFRRPQTLSGDARHIQETPDTVRWPQTLSWDARHIQETPDTFRRLQTLSGGSRHIQDSRNTFRRLETRLVMY